MSFLTLWLLVFILEKSIATKNRNVNLALETVLQFDKSEDLNVVNKVQDFLSQIQVLLKNKRPISDNASARRNKKYKFIDFVEDLITTVKSFKDNDLKEVFRIVDKDFRTRKVDNGLIDDNAKNVLARKLTEIRKQPARNIRSDLEAILNKLRTSSNNKNGFILDFVNTLYKRKSERKLLNLIKRLNLFRNSSRKSKVVLKTIIEKVVNDVIYKHYNNLEDNQKNNIKKFVKSYILYEVTTPKKLKIKQRAKVAEIAQESINTYEKIDESKPTEKITTFDLTPKTFKDIPKATTKKIFTHITLYPKTINVDKIPKFRTGSPAVDIETMPADEDNSLNKMVNRYDQDTKESNELFANHSVEIKVSLMLKQSQESQDQEDSQMVESLSTKSTPIKVLLRALKKKSNKNQKHHISSTPALSKEAFGSLYKVKTPKKKFSRFNTYNGKTTIKERYFKPSDVDDIINETSLRDIHLVGDHRRVHRPINFNEEKVTESYIKYVGTTTIQNSLTTRASIPLFIATHKNATPVVTTDKSTTKTTQSNLRNEVFDNENVNELKEATKKTTLFERRTYPEFKKNYETMQFKNDSIKLTNNKTTVSKVSAIPFDLKKYLKQSEVLNFKDDARKKQIEENMKADLGLLLEAPSENATTEGFTDIFKELEEAFQI